MCPFPTVRARGKTVIIAEHRLYYLMDAVDRVVYLENGKIAGDYTPEQLMSLTKNERQSMGLRNTSLREERPMRFEKHEQKPAVLEVENIALAYKKQPILRSVSLKAEAGEVIAVVGHNGAGKTTFSRALCGLHKEESGVYLWKGKPQKPKERMKFSYIMKLPNGYETVLGEAGGTLSGGERQRLSIARAMMKDAPIIILDEATANVDPENEKELMEAIHELTTEKTVIMIAHRLKTVREAQQIIVVDKGKIAQRGTHDELMRQDGIYRRFISGREKAVGWKI